MLCGAHADTPPAQLSWLELAHDLQMKLLLPDIYTERNAYTWNYPLRNIYSLGGNSITLRADTLEVEVNGSSSGPAPT